ncbi:hypothetical protein N7489_011359 [Penicillium chrysogenum]|uniref:uncharacterized protein n=1 Tax=Penicillium chrysogenum TaxID=5076 RepID=UPI0024DF2AA7|nr:uncharacterized protein N7489_011359 [Penicillium chrysogenum]KAJ5230651.1 hypothetical protein N7489_011359 [Penicillium chrysogenum]
MSFYPNQSTSVITPADLEPIHTSRLYLRPPTGAGAAAIFEIRRRQDVADWLDLTEVVMTYGKRPGLDVKLMRAMKPSQEIVIHDISQVDFYSNLTYTVRLRAATTQIVGTQAPTPCKRCENTTWPFTECPLQDTAVATRQHGSRPKVVLQGKVTKLKREVRHFDETLKSIQSAMTHFLNEEPTKTQQFQINGGLVTLKSSVDDVLEAMKDVSLKHDDKDGEEDNEREDEEDHEKDGEEDDEEGDEEDDNEEDEAEDEEQ